MKSVRLAIYLFVAMAQIAVPGSMMWARHQTLSQGRLWKFRTAPVDPVDVIRGRYLRLRFAAEEFPRTTPLPYYQTFYARLKEDAAGFAIIEDVGTERVHGDNVVQVEGYGSSDGKGHVLFPFSELWITEENAQAAERAYTEHSKTAQSDAYVTVRIRDGNAAIEQLFIAGLPLREYLRLHPQ
jgi:uncharacterized membrane-anchored protein